MCFCCCFRETLEIKVVISCIEKGSMKIHFGTAAQVTMRSICSDKDLIRKINYYSITFSHASAYIKYDCLTAESIKASS